MCPSKEGQGTSHSLPTFLPAPFHHLSPSKTWISCRNSYCYVVCPLTRLPPGSRRTGLGSRRSCSASCARALPWGADERHHCPEENSHRLPITCGVQSQPLPAAVKAPSQLLPPFPPMLQARLFLCRELCPFGRNASFSLSSFFCLGSGHRPLRPLQIPSSVTSPALLQEAYGSR